MTNEQINTDLRELVGLLVPVVGALVDVAYRECTKHFPGCGCEVCRAFIAVHQCQARLEVLARALAPAALLSTAPPPGYDCLVGE